MSKRRAVAIAAIFGALAALPAAAQLNQRADPVMPLQRSLQETDDSQAPSAPRSASETTQTQGEPATPASTPQGTTTQGSGYSSIRSSVPSEQPRGSAASGASLYEEEDRVERRRRHRGRDASPRR